MDEWGHGPWFNSDESNKQATPEDDPDAQGAQGGDPFNEGSMGNEDPTSPGASGGFRMPPIASRPLGPDRSYITGDPDQQSGGWYSAASGPVSEPFLPDDPRLPPYTQPRRGQPLGMGGGAGAGGGNNKNNKKKTRNRGWVFVLAVALLLIVCSTAGVLTGFISQIPGLLGQHGGVSVPTILAQPTATATATPIPTATPNIPVAATLTFSVATVGKSSSGSMTSCPSGCNISGKSYSSSQNFSGSYAASHVDQSRLFGSQAIQVTNNSSSAWSPGSYSFKSGGGTYTCSAQTVSVSAHSTRSFDCFIGVSSPSSVPVNTINGTPATNVSFKQVVALTGDAHYEVLSDDCSSAYSDLHSQGNSWASSWWSSQSVPGGWRAAYGSPRISYGSNSCPQGDQQTGAFNFNASSTTFARNAAYNPSAAQALASSRLDGTINGSYAWIYSTRTTCNPTFKGMDGNNKVTLSCSDSGTAYYIWTSSAKASLAKKVAGHSKSVAVSTCNKTTGVKSNSCSISIIGGDGSKLPAADSGITIDPKGP